MPPAPRQTISPFEEIVPGKSKPRAGPLAHLRLEHFLAFSALLHAALLALCSDPLQNHGRGSGSPLVITLAPGDPEPAAAILTPKAAPPEKAVKPCEARKQKTAPSPADLPPKRAGDTEKKRRPESARGIETGPRPPETVPDSPSSLPDAVEKPLPATATSAGFEEPSGALAGSGSPWNPAAFGTREGPRLVGAIRPDYPPQARRLQKEGQVVIQLRLDRNGALCGAKVVKGAGFGFDEAALAAIRKARFLPAVRDGRPVPCLALLPIRFTIRTGI
ncbi:MAG: energy transducer TonB [Deltaproteobacteria bacterium]|nr:energy transducer TonB [Deltaproteobacteria bacterium]